MDNWQQQPYSPSGITLQRFHDSPAFVRGIMGPFGSAKSTACVMEILKLAHEQTPHNGIRYSRWVIVRNSYPELKTTTIKTWGQWCPLRYGKTNFDSPIVHHVKTKDLDMEVLFLALDREEDVKKLLSLEVSGAWLNETREVPKAIVDGLTGRVGRYPPRNMSGGCTRKTIIMDTNPPDDQHWWYRLAEEETPENWEFFRQPSGRSPDAENIENLPKDYYKDLMTGKDPDWIKVYVDGEYGYVVEGKAVYPSFRDSVHVSPVAFEPNPAFPLRIGADFGLTPAAVIGQLMPDGRWLIVDEVVTDNFGVVRFAETLARYVGDTYSDFTVGGCWGDPAGDARGNDEKTTFDLMREHTGWEWKPAPSNDIPLRLEVVMGCLNRMIDGKPGILFSPKCKMLRKGCSGGYYYSPVRTANGTRFHDKPTKNDHSHPQDALQYLLLGSGEKNVVTGRMNRLARGRGPRMAVGMNYDLFSTSDDSNE